MTVETLPGLLEAQASARPGSVAIRVKRLGLWREFTWKVYSEVVRETALALDAIGVGPGDAVAIYAANDPRWLVSDLGIQTVGALSVGLQSVQDPDELAANLKAANAKVIICGDQEQVDNVLAVTGDAKPYEQLVVFDMKGLHTPGYRDAGIVSFEDFRASGREVLAADGARHAALLARLSDTAPAVVSFTSGTTGAPRGILLSHFAQIAAGRALAERIDLKPDDRCFSLLPLGHASGRAFDVVAPLVAGASVNFPESPETIAHDMAEISPTVIFATPKVYERIRSIVEVRIARAAPFKRWVYGIAMARLEASLAARRAGGGGGFSAFLGGALAGNSILKKAGLSSLRYAGVGGASVSSNVTAWFWQLGIPLYEHYGQVETGGILFAQRGLADSGTLGTAVAPGIEVRRGEEGELLVRSPALLSGVLGEATAPPADGWYATGDVAEFDADGRLLSVARRSEVLRLASGAEVSATAIGSALQQSPYIAAAVVVGEGRAAPAALIEIQQEAVADWAKDHEIAVTTYAALATNSLVRDLIAAEVAAANLSLAEGTRVDSFAITPRPLHDELTATGKVRRDLVLEHHADTVSAL